MAGTVVTRNIANADQDPSPSSPSAVAVGTVVKAVYAEIWILGTSQQPATTTTVIMKNPGGDNIDATDFTDLNSYNQKNNIFEMHQGLVGDANANPVPFYRGWIKIPKGKQRLALGDALQFSLKCITEDVQWCGIFIFKAYN